MNEEQRALNEMLAEVRDPAKREQLARQGTELFAKITPLFVGVNHAIIGAVLASLTAMWLRCAVAEDVAEESSLRNDLLEAQVRMIRDALEAAIREKKK